MGPDRFVVSLDAAGTLGGLAFADEDLLEVSLGVGGPALVYDGSAAHAGWIAADLEAIAVPEPGASAMLISLALLIALGRRPGARGDTEVVRAIA